MLTELVCIARAASNLRLLLLLILMKTLANTTTVLNVSSVQQLAVTIPIVIFDSPFLFSKEQQQIASYKLKSCLYIL